MNTNIICLDPVSSNLSEEDKAIYRLFISAWLKEYGWPANAKSIVMTKKDGKITVEAQ